MSFIVTSLTICIILPCLIASCLAADTADKGVYVNEVDKTISFGNENVEIVLDKESGYFSDIWNKSTGLHHKIAGTGMWPYSLRVGTLNTPDLMRVDNSPSTRYSQKAKRSIERGKDATTLKLSYPDLISSGGMQTGVAMDVSITLKEGGDYFLVRADLHNKGKYQVTKLSAGAGEFTADESRENEKLAVPTCTSGTIWSNPFSFFTERETFGYPIFGSDVILEAGWMDLYGPKGGIGIGYINRQGLTMYFNVKKGSKGMTFNWQLFNLYHEGAVESWAPAGGIYPLKPGEKMSTDDWIIAPHTGDWHRMADIYRMEYERAFKGDYLDWESTHEVARNLDTTAGFVIFDARSSKKAFIQFSELADRTKTFIENSKINPKNLVVVMVAHGSHAGKWMPDFLPSAPEAGGDEAFRQAIIDIRKLGVEGILFYGHSYYNHPKAADYVADADTGYDLSNAAWGDIGNIACLDCDGWQDLWRRKYIPGYDALGSSGVYWDQGGTQYVVCTNPDHSHGGSATGILGSQIRGTEKLLKSFRDGFKNRRPFFMCESGQDLEMRHTDIWDCQCKIASYAKGGERCHEIIRYTFPYHVVAEATGDADGRCDALVNGFALQGGGGRESEENAAALQQFFRVRRELREANAPGYPYGFRDQVGLTVNSADVVARSYRGNSGITVLYYAKKPVSAEIVVDQDALGLQGKGRRTIPVTLKAYEADYTIITP